MTTPVSPGIIIHHADAETLTFPHQSARLFTEGAGTNGAFSTLRMTMKPAADGARPHHHAKATEMFFVIEGALDILVGERVVTASPGDLAAVSPGTMHAFANASDSESADALIIFGPGIERFDYFRLLLDVVSGRKPFSEILESQERFDNWFSDSAAWATHQAAVKQQRS